MLSLFEKSKSVNVQDGSTAWVLRGMVARGHYGMVMMPPGIAQRILDELNFIGQRKVKEPRVLKHLARMESGQWRGSFCISFAVLPDGSLMLVDGQHRLRAIVRFGAPQPITVQFHDVRDEQEARRIYAGFDEGDSNRTAAEMMDAVGVAGKLDLPRAFANKLYSALPILRNDLEPLTGSEIEAATYVRLFGVDARLDAITDWRDEAVKYMAVIGKTTGRVRQKLQGAGCMAVALYTFRHQPAKAHEFWHGLADNDGLRARDPRAALLRDMQERSGNTGTMRQNVQAPVLAWNAFCGGRELKIIKCITGGAIAPWGTPMSGRK